MKGFAYLKDGVFLAASTAYFVNRFALQEWWHQPFLTSYLNDLLLIPCALPVMLWLHRWMGLRTHDRPPETGEMFMHLLIWSVVCEWVGPALIVDSASDIMDVAAYSAGGAVSMIFWHRHRLGSWLGLAA